MKREFPHPDAARRARQRRTISVVFWTVLCAGPFFGTTQGAAVPVLAQVAHLSDRAYGFLQAIYFIALLVQIPGALLVSAVFSRPRTIFWTGLWRLVWVPAAAVPLLLPPGPTATLSILALVTLAWLGQHLSGLTWQAFVGDLIPRRRRGRYFGNRTRLTSVATLLTSIGLAMFLPSQGQAHAAWIVLAVFVVAAAIGGAEVFFYPKMYDPPRTRPAIRVSNLLVPFADRAFMPFLGFTFIISFANNVVAPFLWRHLMGPVGLSPMRTTLILQTAALIGTIAMAPLWGLWTDRHGTKAAYVFAIAGSTLAMLAWPLVSAEHWWAGLVLQFASAAFWAGVDVANTSRVFAHATAGGPGCLAAFNTATAVAAFTATAVGGELMQRAHGWSWVQRLTTVHNSLGLTFTAYSMLIAACVLLRMGGLAYLMRYVRRDGPAPTAAGVKAMAMQMQSGLMGLIYLPLRSFRAGQ